MVRRCEVCQRQFQSGDLNTSYHRFPRDANVLEVWKKIIGKVKIMKDARICSNHFHSSDIKYGPAGKKLLRVGAKPVSTMIARRKIESIFDPPKSDLSENSSTPSSIGTETEQIYLIPEAAVGTSSMKKKGAHLFLTDCDREDLKDKIDNLPNYRLCSHLFQDKPYLNDLNTCLMPTIFQSVDGSSNSIVEIEQESMTSQNLLINNPKTQPASLAQLHGKHDSNNVLEQTTPRLLNPHFTQTKQIISTKSLQKVNPSQQKIEQIESVFQQQNCDAHADEINQQVNVEIDNVLHSIKQEHIDSDNEQYKLSTYMKSEIIVPNILEEHNDYDPIQSKIKEEPQMEPTFPNTSFDIEKVYIKSEFDSEEINNDLYPVKVKQEIIMDSENECILQELSTHVKSEIDFSYNFEYNIGEQVVQSSRLLTKNKRSDTDSEYENGGAPGPSTKKKLGTEIVHKKYVSTYSRQDFKPSETQSTNASRRLKKAPKTSAERGREFRARKALLKQQSKQQQEPDAIVEIDTEDTRSADPSEDNQFPGPSEIKTIEKRAKSAEATRRWRERKKGVSESSKKQAKTAAQRMREYRKRKKIVNSK